MRFSAIIWSSTWYACMHISTTWVLQLLPLCVCIFSLMYYVAFMYYRRMMHSPMLLCRCCFALLKWWLFGSITVAVGCCQYRRCHIMYFKQRTSYSIAVIMNAKITHTSLACSIWPTTSVRSEQVVHMWFTCTVRKMLQWLYLFHNSCCLSILSFPVIFVNIYTTSGLHDWLLPHTL
jgi:hypothetical protein